MLFLHLAPAHVVWQSGKQTKRETVRERDSQRERETKTEAQSETEAETETDSNRQKLFEQAETVRDRRKESEREREFERPAGLSSTATLFFHLAPAQVAWETVTLQTRAYIHNARAHTYTRIFPARQTSRPASPALGADSPRRSRSREPPAGAETRGPSRAPRRPAGALQVLADRSLFHQSDLLGRRFPPPAL